MKYKILFICLLFGINGFAQLSDSIQVSGQLKNNLRFAKIVIKQFGIGSTDIAVIPISQETGKFNITLPPNIPNGMYRFQYSQTSDGFVDVVVNGKEKEIIFEIDVSKDEDKRFPVFLKSDENQSLQNFIHKRNKLLTSIQVLDQFIEFYPEKEEVFYNKILKQRSSKVTNYLKYRTNFIKSTPYFYAKQVAVFSQSYFPNPTEDWRLRAFHKFENFWNDKLTNNANLLNTPLYAESILEYIKYYMNPEMNFSENEMNEGFKICVDNIIKVFSQDEKTLAFAIKYLQLGFKEIGNETLLQYIDEKYASTAQCLENDTELNKRLVGYEALKPGIIAPNFTLMSIDGKEKNLVDFKQKKVALVFWASWCPHCMLEMPKIESWAKSHPEVLVLAISLDEDYTQFQKAVNDYPSMMHYCDLQKWNGEIVTKYYVSATPTFFLLDEAKKIVGKYKSFEELELKSKD